MKFVPGGTSGNRTYSAFWSCPDKKKVDGKWNEHSSVNDEEYRKSLAKAAQHPVDPPEPGSNG